MTDNDLEQLIRSRGNDVLRLNELANALTLLDNLASYAMRSEAQRTAADVAVMVAMRSPERVREMEIERGLA